MKKSAFVLIFCLLLVLFLSELSFAEKVKVRIVDNNANIRLKPDLKSSVISKPPLGVILESDKKVGEWFRVNLPPDENGFIVTGYIHSSIVEIMDEEALDKKEVKEKPVPPPKPSKPPGYPPSPGLEIGVKFSGGMSYLLIGDPNSYLVGREDSLLDWARVLNYTHEGEFKKLHWGSDFEGDVIVYLTPQLGVSIGSGYIYGKKGKDAGKITGTRVPSSITDTSTVEMKASAIPIRLGAYYYLPVSSKNRFFLNGGVGYYFAKLSIAYRTVWNGSEYTKEQEASGKGIGFQGGIGFEYDISKNIAFMIEGQGRCAKIGGFEGNLEIRSPGLNTSEEGTLYYYEYQDTWTPTSGWYPTVRIEDQDPSGTDYRNVREAIVDFSGFTFRAGIKIKF